MRALAAVAAATGAMAQATISGEIATAFDKVKGSKSTSSMSTADIHFGVSEDLGGGLRASARVTLDMAQARDADAEVLDSSMSLAGGFGTIGFNKTRAGNTAMNARLYGADLPTAAVNTAGVMSNLSVRSEVQVISYTSPEVMPGLRLNVGQAQLFGAVDATKQTRDRVEGATVNIIGATYTSGPLSIGFTHKNNSKAALAAADATAIAYNSQDFTFVDHASNAADTAVLKKAAYDAGVLKALGGKAEKTVNELSVAYDLGVARVAYGYGGKLTANGKALQVFGVTAPVASNITVGLTSGKRGDVKFQELGATYAFSKRTSLQFATGSFTARSGKVAGTISGSAIVPGAAGSLTAAIAGATYTSPAAAKTTQTRIRLVHTF